MIFCRLRTLHGEMHITMPLHESLLSSSIVAHYNQYSQCMSLSKTELLCYLRMKGDTLRSRNAVCHICAPIRSTLLASSRHHSSIMNNFTNTMTCNLPRWRRINFAGMTSHASHRPNTHVPQWLSHSLDNSDSCPTGVAHFLFPLF